MLLVDSNTDDDMGSLIIVNSFVFILNMKSHYAAVIPAVSVKSAFIFSARCVDRIFSQGNLLLLTMLRISIIKLQLMKHI